ncbi:Wzz/FepE/Etk N-terminal domain-containing protein [Pseudogemmobacter sonorensis]|uniref:Wzz/FepE/Etk N-terminal domain-containing protein n=1 Tax=Pseudogemmobacter sonorensis TaxID=2989681 RepID=UPI00367AB01E
MGQIQNIEDLLNFLWRRRWLIALVTVIGVVCSAIYAKTRPDRFEASAAIQVQGAQVGADGAVMGSAKVLEGIQQRLTTREALLGMIARHGLYTDLPGLSDEQKISLLRASIFFHAIESSTPAAYGQGAQISAIIISAADGTAGGAARIANDLAQSILDLSSSGQIERARETRAFYLEDQTRLAAEIAALEGDIAAYKNANADSMPTSSDLHRSELVGIDSDLRALDQSLVALMEEQRQLVARSDLRETERRRLQELENQIAVMAGQKSALNSRRDALLAAISRLPEVERGLAGMERELELLQASLGATSARLIEAETALRLAERQQGERFALLDRAVTPEYPVGTNGRKLFAAGSVAAFLVALGLAFALDLMRPVVRTSAQMERQLGLRPVIAIPEIDFAGVARRRHPVLQGAATLRDRALELPRPVLIGAALVVVLLTGAAMAMV